MKSIHLIIFLSTLFVTSCTNIVQSEAPSILIEDMQFTANEIVVEEDSGFSVLPDGLGLDENSYEGVYTSTEIEAPIPYNAVVPHWKAEIPINGKLELFIRFGSSTGDWGEWMETHPAPDWILPEDEAITGDMFVVPANEGKKEYIQYLVRLGRNDRLTHPVLQEITFTFIDSTAGPTTEELIIKQDAIDSSSTREQENSAVEEGTFEKPVVISRDIWCTDPRCVYSSGLNYHPVTHLILHHTVSGGGSADTAAIVRAIWAYHAFTRDWGDIGYNYVVDEQGVLFEGHYGGDDVVGIHAREANTGSMALAAIGDYRDITPTEPMVKSIVDLFSWKAGQQGIDVFESSDALPYIDWGLPHIMGHRDVFGTTICPGDQAHDLIPMIRDLVAERIGLESPHIYVDELSDQFIKSEANWYEPIYQCGHNTHSWYTWSTTDPGEAANWGEWRPNISASGKYLIEAHIPFCNTTRSESTGANYRIDHADGTSMVTINMQDNVGLWASLGEFNLTAGNGNVIHLSDLTTTDDGLGVWFDAIRLLPLEKTPTALNENPQNGAWLTQRDIQFQWQIEEPDLVVTTVLEIAQDEEFQLLLERREWASAVTSATIPFSQDYSELYWRVILLNEAGESIISQTTQFGIDTEPPTSSMSTPLWLSYAGQYLLSWTGDDQLNSVKSFIIEVREKNDENAAWLAWVTDTTAVNTFFKPPDEAKIYEFRSRAQDTLGNMESDTKAANTDTSQAFILSHAIMLPVISR